MANPSVVASVAPGVCAGTAQRPITRAGSMAGLAPCRLYERDAELRIAADLLGKSAAHQGGLQFFAGDAGLGKTVLLQHIERSAAGVFRVGTATGDPVETPVAFSFLSQVLDNLGCPVTLAEAGERGASASDRRGVQFHRVLRWVRDISEPTLLALDDLQWADSDSVALLSFLCRRIAGLPLAVIVTLRSWPPAAHDIAHRLSAAGYAALTDLAPLSDTAAEQVVTDRVHSQASAPAIKLAVAMCGGNPLLLELASTLIDRGDNLSSPPLSTALPNPQSLLLSRFTALPAELMRCAKAASIFGTRFQPSVAAKVAQVPEQDIERTLDALARSGLVRDVEHHVVEFVHPLVSRLLYADLGGALREQLHRRACLVLTGQGLDREAAEHVIRGHLVGDREAITVLERVALDELRQGALASAAEHLRAAIELSGQRATPAALQGTSEALLALGRTQEAIEYCERIMAMPALTAVEQARAAQVLGRGLAVSGRLGDACEHLAQAVARARDTRPALAAVAQAEHAYYRWRLSGPAAALPLLPAARELAGAGSAATRARVAAICGFVALQAGDPSGLDDIAALGSAVLGTPLVHMSAFPSTWCALSLSGCSAMLAEQLPVADETFRSGLAIAQQIDASSSTDVLCLTVCHAELLRRLGRLKEAMRLVERVPSHHGVPPALAAMAQAIIADVLLQLGRLDEADEWMSRAAGTPGGQSCWMPRLRLLGLQGLRALRAGAWKEASTCYTAAEEISVQAGVNEPCLSQWARHAIVAHLRADRIADAQRVLGWLDGRAASLPCLWPRIAALSGRAGLAELSGDTEAAQAAFTEALRLHDGLELPLERIETLLEFGSFLRRSGAAARARPLLAEAVAAADTIGARWLGRQAHVELAASGGRRRRRSEKDSRLTPQERRVFELAARGLSNEAIASTLTVSARTVKTHLEHIYTKLGVHSRRELMLRGDRAPSGPGNGGQHPRPRA